MCLAAMDINEHIKVLKERAYNCEIGSRARK